MCRRFLEILNWHGIAEIDVRWTGRPNDKFYLIEVNPRMFGGLHQAIASGWDYPWMLFQMAATGRMESLSEIDRSVKTETPLLGLLGTLQDACNQEDQIQALERCWREAGRRFKSGNWLHGIEKVLSGLGEFVDLERRYDRACSLFEDHKDSISSLFSTDDPLPILGAMYPLAVFFKHGKVNTNLLTSVGSIGGKTAKAKGENFP